MLMSLGTLIAISNTHARDNAGKRKGTDHKTSAVRLLGYGCRVISFREHRNSPEHSQQEH